MTEDRSKELFAEAVSHFPGGVNSPVRAKLSIRRHFVPTWCLADDLRPFRVFPRLQKRGYYLLMKPQTDSQLASPCTHVLMNNLG